MMDYGIWACLKAWVYVNTQMAAHIQVNGTKVFIMDTERKYSKTEQLIKVIGSMEKPKDSV